MNSPPNVVPSLFSRLKTKLPFQLWSLLSDKFPFLAPIMTQVFKAPASSAGIERQHKVGKQVHSSRRSRLSPGSVEMQVAVTYNIAASNRVVSHTRHRFEHHLATIFNTVEVTNQNQHVEGSDDQDDEDYIGHEILEARVYEAITIDAISDVMVYGPPVDDGSDSD